MPRTPASAIETPEQFNLKALSGLYRINVVGADKVSCTLRLDADDVARGPDPIRLVAVEPLCFTALHTLHEVAQWAPRGPGSLALFDRNHKELGDFSPVQDGTGVYLRGGVSDQLFEMRQTQQ